MSKNSPLLRNIHTKREIAKLLPLQSQLSVHLTANCGEGGIRTPGTLRYASFQDWCIRPLCHLSYTREPDRIRTCDRLLRRQMLYPAELRVQFLRGFTFMRAEGPYLSNPSIVILGFYV